MPRSSRLASRHALRAVAALLALLPSGCAERGDPDAFDDAVSVHVGMVGLDENNAPVVILEEDDGPRLLHIWIGIAEARSIAAIMEENPPPRPNTHDLAQRLLQGLESEITHVVVSDLREGIYFAVITIRNGSELLEIDARPSDAIALALRVGAPILVESRLLDPPSDESDTSPSGREVHFHLMDGHHAGAHV